MNLEEMNGPELVHFYNALANSEQGKIVGARTVVRFADIAAGRKRIAMLQSQIRAREEGLASAAKQPGKSKAVEVEPGNAQAAPEQPTTKPAAAAATTEVKETSDMSKTKSEQIIEAFGLRAGTNREKCVKKLVEHFGKSLPRKDLLKATYGSMNEENVGALAMVLKGTDEMIKKNKLPYVLKREKVDGEFIVGLHAK